MDIKERIIEILKESGPLLPVELAKKSDINTWVLNAFLAELITKGEILSTKTKIGNSPLFYLPEHKDRIEDKLFSFFSDDKKLCLKKIKEKQIIFQDELKQEEIEILKTVPDLVEGVELVKSGKRLICWKWHTVRDDEVIEYVRNLVGGEKEHAEEPSKEMTEVINNKDVIRSTTTEDRLSLRENVVKLQESNNIDISNQSVSDSSKFLTYRVCEIYGNIWPGCPLDYFINFFAQHGIKTVDRREIERNRLYRIIVDMPLPTHIQRYILMIRNKKVPVSPTELIEAYMDALENKIPLIFISSSGFSNRAIDYHRDNMGHFLILIAIEKLIDWDKK